MKLSNRIVLFNDEDLSSDVNSAAKDIQTIYIQAVSGTLSVAAPSAWVSVSDEPVTGTPPNASAGQTPHWTAKRPTYQSNYPIIFIAEQRRGVNGLVTCSTPLKDDSQTIIDGGHITTGTIDASQVNVTNINGANINAGTLAIGKLDTNAQNTISDASKVATNYITPINDAGIFISPANQSPTTSSTGNSVEIDGTGMNVYKGGVSVAKYGDSSRVGKETSGHTNISSSGMVVYGGNGSIELANIGYGNGKAQSGTTAVAPYYSLGQRTGDIGNYSVAEGYLVTASGYASHAEGGSNEGNKSTEASGVFSHAEGLITTASGFASHAEGYKTKATGSPASKASNYMTTAASKHQTAIGRLNVADSNDTYALIIGNGSETTTSTNLSNALAVDWNGNLRLKGNVYVGCNADSSGGILIGKPTCAQIGLPYTPTKSGLLIVSMRAQVAGRVYITFSNAAPTIADGNQVSGGYVNSVHFCNGGTEINATSSHNLYEVQYYYVTWG